MDLSVPGDSAASASNLGKCAIFFSGGDCWFPDLEDIAAVLGFKEQLLAAMYLRQDRRALELRVREETRRRLFMEAESKFAAGAVGFYTTLGDRRETGDVTLIGNDVKLTKISITN